MRAEVLVRLLSILSLAAVVPAVAQEPPATAERLLPAEAEAVELKPIPRPDLRSQRFNAAAFVLPQRQRGPVLRGASADGFNWNGAIWQSTFFLGIQHGFRFATEPGTRAELRGPFFRDWGTAIRGIRGWGDGDPFIVNYVGHPMQGAVTGYIQIHNDPKGIREEFGKSKAYWRSRLKAMGWNAAYSTMFEIGPVSEATLGNVGKPPFRSGWVDLVVTPTIGTAWLVGEDALDRFVVIPVERWNNAWVTRLTRSFLNPSRTFANAMRFKKPWYRDTRPSPGYRPPLSLDPAGKLPAAYRP